MLSLLHLSRVLKNWSQSRLVLVLFFRNTLIRNSRLSPTDLSVFSSSFFVQTFKRSLTLLPYLSSSTSKQTRMFRQKNNKNETVIFIYRVCQGLWPSLIFADEDIEPQIFWASSKSHVATTFLYMHFCSNYIGWSNQGKYYEIETHYAKQDVAT